MEPWKKLPLETQDKLQKMPVSAFQARIMIDNLREIKYALIVIAVILALIGYKLRAWPTLDWFR